MQINNSYIYNYNHYNLSFNAMKKRQFKGIDLAVVNRTKAPIEKFNVLEDFQNFCKNLVEKLRQKIIRKDGKKPKYKEKLCCLNGLTMSQKLWFLHDKVEEVQGELNNSNIPVEYYDTVKGHLKGCELNYVANEEIKALEKAKIKLDEIKSKFPDGINNAPVKKNFRRIRYRM